ncbi:MAG: hypothetical protein JKY11_05065 [Alphaproteobacteria bacterium]|nr:hypothetical protein [Alphaproteobacteria bacterium]
MGKDNMNYLQNIWQYELQILPVLLFILLYETPALLRRLHKTHYVPIYFSIYPFKQINQNLSIYLGEDYYCDEGWRLDKKKASNLRDTIIKTSIISMSLDAIFIPLIIGFIVAFFLPQDLFKTCLITLLSYKFITIIASLKNSHLHFIEKKGQFFLLSGIYFVYLGCIQEMLKTSYNWATPFVSEKEWFNLLNALSTFIFAKVFIMGFIIVVLSGVFTSLITDRKLREQNISHDE